MIVSGICLQAVKDFLDGVHQPEDDYRVALYTKEATLHPSTTTAYSPVGEVSGHGYQVGGQELKGRTSGTGPTGGWLGWKTSPRWANSTIKARGALIYNKSKNGRAVAIFDFGKEVVSTNGPFEIPMPQPGPMTAPIQFLVAM